MSHRVLNMLHLLLSQFNLHNSHELGGIIIPILLIPQEYRFPKRQLTWGSRTRNAEGEQWFDSRLCGLERSLPSCWKLPLVSPFLQVHDGTSEDLSEAYPEICHIEFSINSFKVNPHHMHSGSTVTISSMGPHRHVTRAFPPPHQMREVKDPW